MAFVRATRKNISHVRHFLLLSRDFAVIWNNNDRQIFGLIIRVVEVSKKEWNDRVLRIDRFYCKMVEDKVWKRVCGRI